MIWHWERVHMVVLEKSMNCCDRSIDANGARLRLFLMSWCGIIWHLVRVWPHQNRRNCAVRLRFYGESKYEIPPLKKGGNEAQLRRFFAFWAKIETEMERDCGDFGVLDKKMNIVIIWFFFCPKTQNRRNCAPFPSVLIFAKNWKFSSDRGGKSDLTVVFWCKKIAAIVLQVR